MVIIVMGVSGSGKTAVGRALADRLGAAFIDADDHHSAANKAKMASGEPLTEADRGPWLSTLRRMIDEALAAGRDIVMACSALTRRSRAALGAGESGGSGVEGVPGAPRVTGARRVRLVHLAGSRELIARRLGDRKGHFMPPGLLDSQFTTLEPPDDAEAIVESIDAPVDAIVDRIARRLSA